MGDDDPETSVRAATLGVSREALFLCSSSDVVDLHVDSFIWTRILGYDVTERHAPGPFGAPFFGQADLPRLAEAGVTGAIWVITTNPLRTARGRAEAFFRNLAELSRILATPRSGARVVKTVAEYRDARRDDLHGAFVGVQGGNALDHDLSDWSRASVLGIVRVTLVHLSSSRIGSTSSPLAREDRGLTRHGRDLVRRLNEEKILVDLAHISKKGFSDAVSIHDKAQPLIVTHTGVAGVHAHWRNLDDDQLRAIANTGGTIGIMYHSGFLGGSYWGGRASAIADHLDHVIRVVGEDHASLGSDWDGAIVPPRDMPTCLELPRLVQILLDRKWSDARIRKVLGGNFLRVLATLRG